MSTLRKHLLPLAAISFALVACAGGAGGVVAATVNGTDITVADVQATRIQSADDDGTIDKVVFATDLTGAIVDRVVIEAVSDEFAIEPTPEEIDAKILQLGELITVAQGISLADFLQNEGLTDSQFRVIANQQVIRDKLIEHFRPDVLPGSDADAELLRTAEGLRLVSVCASHILVPTEEEALAAKVRIDGGEAFATVATELGTDPTAASGGDLGCAALSRYVPEFAEAASNARLGVVTNPVASEFGWHLILVRERDEPTLAELKERITGDRINQLVDAWLLGAFTDAVVEVNAEYGTWVIEPVPQVVPPTG
jgi:parvulin-like peptidyl-prolyl isomerase